MENLFKMKYKIFLVPFPFDDLSTSKVRPAVCLTDPIGPHRHVVLAFISSRTPVNPLPTDLVIDLNDPGFTVTGLRVSSTLQLHRLMTATTSFLQRELGILSLDMQAQTTVRLKILFGF
jgi:mRNA interferase MazF